jgi:glycosyltransferase involved in cell wall biosynthesis
MLSIIIPCFNEESTIEKIVDKVINSTNNLDREIILVDDFSNDNTRTIIKNNLQDKIEQIIFNSKNY